MTLFAFRGAKSHEWTFCDHIKIDLKNTVGGAAYRLSDGLLGY